MTPGRLLHLLKRDFQRGFRGAINYHLSTDSILSWRFPYWALAAHPVPLHVVAGKEDWKPCAWMLVSFFINTKHNWPIFVHDDGTLPTEAAESLMKMFPQITVIWREEADAAMEPVLEPHPNCRKFRSKHAAGLRIFDPAYLSAAPRFILLDSHVLFFKRPDKILEWADSDSMECWFNRDVQETPLMSVEEAQQAFEVPLWKRVSTGLCLLTRKAIEIGFCERVFSETGILSAPARQVEQTLFALCASRSGAGGLLPEAYELSHCAHARPASVMRNYVEEVRDRFYSEGMDRIKLRLAPPG